MPEQLAAWIRRPPVAVSGLALLGLGVAFAFATSTGEPSPEGSRVLGNRFEGSGGSGRQPGKDKDDKKAFTIAGGVTGLVPGDTEPLVLTLASASNFPISVTALSVAVGSAGPGCSSGNLSVSPFAGPVTVPANGSSTTTLNVTLSPSAPDACKAITWPLSYTGTAVKP